MKELRFVCTDFPGPGSECVFVECEDENGHGINAGEWKREGRWAVLHVDLRALLSAPQEREARKACEVCPHPEHYGPCLHRNGDTAYQCPCLADPPIPSPAPAALSPAVREAAEKYREAREAGDCRCPGGDCKHALEERYRARNLADALLSVLDSNGGA